MGGSRGNTGAGAFSDSCRAPEGLGGRLSVPSAFTRPAAPPVTPAWLRPWDRFLDSRAAIPALSVFILLPCFWQSRIQAGDLSSHIYNAWLAAQASHDALPGLTVVSQYNNVLVDLALGALLQLFGSAAAQRIVVAAAALLFVWGAFAFVSAVCGRRPWNLLPAIVMLAYGWVFHLGLFNFYISLALVFWALAAVWNGSGWRWWAGAGFLAVGYTAHALPVAWAAAMWAYVLCARRLKPARRLALTGGAIAAAIVVRILAERYLHGVWFSGQLVTFTGADQLWVYGPRYAWPMLALLFLCGLLGLRAVRAASPGGILISIPFQIFALNAAVWMILPDRLMLPGYLAALAFISGRMSLATGVCLCAVLGAVRLSVFERGAMALLLLVFAAMLYGDERALNRYEDSVEAAVRLLPPSSRVINLVSDPDSRLKVLSHVLDRACIGHCYSYGNYEASTAQFRLRVLADNPYVVRTFRESSAIDMGTYLVKPRDIPLYGIDVDSSGTVVTRELKAGAICGGTLWRVALN